MHERVGPRRPRQSERDGLARVRALPSAGGFRAGHGDAAAVTSRARQLARKYVWWQPSEETLADGRLFLAQLMTLGTVEDVRWLLSVATGDDLRAVLHDPPVGIFNARSWSFWHHRLGFDTVPDLPGRRLPR